jgi:hypothetical protein
MHDRRLFEDIPSIDRGEHENILFKTNVQGFHLQYNVQFTAKRPGCIGQIVGQVASVFACELVISHVLQYC